MPSDCGACRSCLVPYSRAWCVGELRKVIDGYKFENMKAASHTLAELLDQRVAQLPSSTTIVPVPTVASHIRVRGYDHAYLLAKLFAHRRNLVLQPLIERITTTEQRDVGRKQRMLQAEAAFRISRELDSKVPYLLIDDIITTGATLKYASKALYDAGAREIWVAVIARQPLD